MPIAFSSSFTSNFPSLLAQLGVSILLSTYQKGRLVTVRARGSELNTHFNAVEKPMGITLAGARLAIGSSHQLVEYYNMPDAAAKIEPPGTHDGCYLPRKIHITGDIDIHEMAYTRDELWLVNTRMSCLCTLDSSHSIVPRWRPPFVSAYDLGDRCHLNGLALRENRPTFVTMLGASNTPGGWRSNKANGGLLMEVPSGRIIAETLSMPHSPRWYRDRLWFLESGKGSLSRIHPETGKAEIVVELPGFTRGISFYGPFAFVGLSQVRETAVFAGLPLTERVTDRRCGVWVVDIEQKEIVAYLVFTGDIREVFAVALLPSRYPTLLDLDDALLRNTYSLPAQALQEVAPPNPLHLKQEQALEAYRTKKYDVAIGLYREILQAKPDLEQARFQLGVLLVDVESWQQARQELELVVQNSPKHAEAWNSLGLCYWGLKQFDQALDAFDQAISADRKFARAQFNRSIALLRRGDYKAGWEAFEWRWQLPEYQPFECPQPQWRGEDIRDKILLVHSEQGNGDAIQFARYLPTVSTRCRKLLLVCAEPLRDLFSAIDGVDEVRLAGALPADDFDLYCPIMTLARVLEVRLDNIPDRFPYLEVPSWVNVPPLKSSGKPKVGLCWRGSPTHNNDKHRSTTFELFRQLIQPEIDFYSLQVPLSTDERHILEGSGVGSLESALTDYARTAAYIKQLDLVISVDTSAAHLAGALNVPVWVLLSDAVDWRWGISGAQTPWYRRAHLFRQQQLDDWESLIAQVEKELLIMFKPCNTYSRLSTDQ